MTPENAQKLYDAFPLLYRRRCHSSPDLAMAINLDCGDGWFDLIWTLSQSINHCAEQEGRTHSDGTWPVATQVKEKCGSLRVYLKNSSAEMATLTGEARTNSEKICEFCGMPGARVAISGIKTLCAAHAQIPQHKY